MLPCTMAYLRDAPHAPRKQHEPDIFDSAPNWPNGQVRGRKSTSETVCETKTLPVSRLVRCMTLCPIGWPLALSAISKRLDGPIVWPNARYEATKSIRAPTNMQIETSRIVGTTVAKRSERGPIGMDVISSWFDGMNDQRSTQPIRLFQTSIIYEFRNGKYNMKLKMSHSTYPKFRIMFYQNVKTELRVFLPQ